MNQIGELPAWRGLDTAMELVREHGDRTGCERLIALDRRGNHLCDEWGSKDRVQLPLSLRRDLRGEVLLVHNHPVAAPVSIPDIFLCFQTHAAGIIATMPEGGWSYCPWEENAREKTLLFNRESVVASNLTRHLFAAGEPLAVVGSVANEEFICALRSGGMLAGYACKPDPKLEQALAKWEGRLWEGALRWEQARGRGV